MYLVVVFGSVVMGCLVLRFSASFRSRMHCGNVANDWMCAESSLKQINGENETNIWLFSFASDTLADDTVKLFLCFPGPRGH